MSTAMNKLFTDQTASEQYLRRIMYNRVRTAIAVERRAVLIACALCALVAAEFSPAIFNHRSPIARSRISAYSSGHSSYETLSDITAHARDWCATNGLMMARDRMFVPCPITLVPSSFSRRHFEALTKLQTRINTLIDKVSRDKEWLIQTLEATSSVDMFTNKLLQIYKDTPEDTIRSHLALGIHRSDYMEHEPLHRPLQVEFNTVSCSFACLSERTHELHRHLHSRFKHTHAWRQLLQDTLHEAHFDRDDLLSNLPPNGNIQRLSDAMAQALQQYSNRAAVVLFVVREDETNLMDQRLLELRLFDDHGIVSKRRTLKQIYEQAQLVGPDNKLWIDGDEVGLVYFRAGYSPTDYPSHSEWEARKTIERSSAIKCPSLGYHLAGVKKVQQKLALPGQLERFLDVTSAQELRFYFAGLYSLDDTDDETRSAIRDAINHPNEYVLKPPREGGGNNIYGNAIRDLLANPTAELRSGYILMQKISPRPQRMAFYKDGELTIAEGVSELGIFGCYLGSGGRPIINEVAGYLLRSKPSDVKEGGVAAGYAVLSTPRLIDDEN